MSCNPVVINMDNFFRCFRKRKKYECESGNGKKKQKQKKRNNCQCTCACNKSSFSNKEEERPVVRNDEKKSEADGNNGSSSR